VDGRRQPHLILVPGKLLQLTIPTELHSAIKRLSHETDLPLAVLVRLALTSFLNNQAKRLPRTREWSEKNEKKT
jgi:hypothetical protein